MTGRHVSRLRGLALAAVFVLCSLSLLPTFRAVATVSAVQRPAAVAFDDTNVLDDLRGSTVDGQPFDLTRWPYDDTGETHRPGIMNVAEYCYSYRANMRGNYGLYLYFYNPQRLDIDTENAGNMAQLAVSYDADGKPVDYEKFSLKYCNKAEESSYLNLFYKFKVIDHESADGKTIAERVNSNGRRYDISGIEIATIGAANAHEYTVAGSYIFSGYATGYGPDRDAPSDLACDVRQLETVELTLYATNYRTLSSAAGKGHQNQLDTVLFSIDRRYLRDYGSLQKIKAEWYEYKTAPIIVTQDTEFYSGFSPYVGRVIAGYDDTIPYRIGTGREYTASGSGAVTHDNYDWSFNVPQSNSSPSYVQSKAICDQLPYLFSTHGAPVKDYYLRPGELAQYIYSYTGSAVNGYLPIKRGDISADLFTDTVDAGRTRGKNTVNIDAGDLFDLRVYGDTVDLWQRVGDYGLWATLLGHTPDDASRTGIDPIYEVKTGDLAGTDADIAERLLIDERDISGGDFGGKSFPDYVCAEMEQDKAVFLFRFAVTDYFAADADTWQGSTGRHTTDKTYMAQETVFLDFDIIQLTFGRDGEYHVIPVVASPIDIIGGITAPIDWGGHGCAGMDIIMLLFWVIVGVIAFLLLYWFIKLLVAIFGSGRREPRSKAGNVSVTVVMPDTDKKTVKKTVKPGKRQKKWRGR